jgi:hypothetical protein
MTQRRNLWLGAVLVLLLLPALAAADPCEVPCNSALDTCRSRAFANYQDCLSESCEDEQRLVQTLCAVPFSVGCRIARLRLLTCRWTCTEGLINAQLQCIRDFFDCQDGTVCPPTRTPTRTRTPTQPIPAIQIPTPTPTSTSTPPRIG